MSVCVPPACACVCVSPPPHVPVCPSMLLCVAGHHTHYWILTLRISPIPENTPNGYHGYWAQNLSQVNAHFGSSESLRQLVTRAQQLGMWVMLDVVANHMGNQPSGSLSNFSQFSPFDSSDSYHSYCQIQDWSNLHQVRVCE